MTHRPRIRYRRSSPPTRKPRLLGLTGGIGSGKSLALDAFRRLGAAVLSSDEQVHAAYDDPEVVATVRDRFGDGVVGSDGLLDRAALGARAFAEADGVAFLERLVHPRVGAARREWERAQQARDPLPPLLVCEVPLLYEAGLEEDFDAVLVVTASEEVRRARVAARGQDFDARAARQIPEDDKIRRADRYLLNDGPEDDLEAWVAARFAEYRR